MYFSIAPRFGVLAWLLAPLVQSIRDSSLQLDGGSEAAEVLADDSSLSLDPSEEANGDKGAAHPNAVTIDAIQGGRHEFNAGDKDEAPAPVKDQKPHVHGNEHGRHHQHHHPHHARQHSLEEEKQGKKQEDPGGHGDGREAEEKGGKEEQKPEEEEEGAEDKGEGEHAEGEGGESDEGEGEEEEEPWAMTFSDKLYLEIGWLILFVVLSLVLVAFMSLISQLSDGSKDIDDGIVEPSELAKSCYWLDLYLMDPLVVLFGLANFVVFAAATELANDPEATSGFGLTIKLKDWVPKTNAALQDCGVVVLTLSLISRALSAPAHPWWKAYRSAAPFVAILLNVYAWFDVIAMTPSVLDLVFKEDEYYNIQALCLVRLVEMSVRTPSDVGAGIRAFIDVFDEDGPLIATIFTFGAVVWVMFSGLYMVANRSNPEPMWEAAAYEGQNWQRFESIPSSMFFALLNLCKEHPLADVFGAEDEQFGSAIFQRVIIVIVCIIGVPVFGVPTGILGASLMKHCHKQVLRMEQARKGPPQAALPPTPGPEEAPDGAEKPAPVAEAAAAPAVADAVADAAPEEHLVKPSLEGNLVRAWLIYTLLASFGTTFVYFLYTVGVPTRILFVWLPEITTQAWSAVDAATSVLFLIEFGARAVTGGLPYMLSPMMLVDVLAFLPGFCSAGLWFRSREVWPCTQGLCVLRVLKAERYVGAFTSMFHILGENGAILKATALTSFLLWLFVSSVLHFTEKENPDEEVQEVYASIPRALWAEIINLHGEWPWCDYTWAGKAIGTLVNFVSIGICMIPVVVFSDAFMAKVGKVALPPDGSEPTQAATLSISDMAAHRWQLKFKESSGFHLYAHLLPPEELAGQSPPVMHRLLRLLSVLFILFGTFTTIIDSLPSLSQKVCVEGSSPWPHCHQLNQFFVGADATLTLIFLIEFLARVVVLRGMYLTSFIGLVDLISLSAFLVTIAPAMHDAGLHPNYESTGVKDIWRDLILPCRLMRLMMLESWTPAIQSLCDVVWVQAAALRKACYALVCVWYMFTVCLYVLEKDSEDEEISSRFANVLVGLPHGLIHLTGDYPCTNYSSISMPFHLVFLILGMCCTGTFTGIFAGGFVEYLGAQRALERRQATEERVRIMVTAISVLQRRVRVRQRRGRNMTEPLPRYNQVTLQKAAQRLLRRQTSLGRVFMGLAQAALVINILNTMLESVPEIEALGPEARKSLTLVEVVTGLIFAIEYFFHFLADPAGLFTTPMRLIDLICLLPTIMRIKFEMQPLNDQGNMQGREAFIESVAACRIIRVLDWPGIAREVQAVKSTLRAALPCLAMPAVISLELWVLTAGIFVWLENMFTGEGDASDQEHMGSIPDALYWCSIYLLGEWANDEFTDGAGSRMCIFYCLCGVALFSIPVGIMVEAGQSTLLKIADERRELEELRNAAKGRGPLPKAPAVKDLSVEKGEPEKIV